MDDNGFPKNNDLNYAALEALISTICEVAQPKAAMLLLERDDGVVLHACGTAAGVEKSTVKKISDELKNTLLAMGVLQLPDRRAGHAS